tara:strand:- start:85 stop:501 length:417 start_codon:yes stop_codon:yes gene_type:complete
MTSTFDPNISIYDQLGGRAPVERLAATFYDVMELEEPELTALHAHDSHTRKVSPEVRERFALFLVGWLGGPAEYMARHGHPRLRMRHAHVPVNIAMRDAWLRCMDEAMRQCQVEESVYRYLMTRFTQVADFMRNVPED